MPNEEPVASQAVTVSSLLLTLALGAFALLAPSWHGFVYVAVLVGLVLAGAAIRYHIAPRVVSQLSGMVLIVGLMLLLFRMPIRPWLGYVGLGLSAVLGFLAFRYFRSSPRLASVGHWLTAGGMFATANISLWQLGTLVGYVGNAPPPPPDSIADPVGQSAAVLAYAQALPYDTSHYAMDDQWLDMRDTVRADTVRSAAGDSSGTYRIVPVVPFRVDSNQGPHARIWPVIGSHRYEGDAFAGSGNGHGRIVARIWIDPRFRGGQGYRKLGYPADTSYLWLDSLRSAPADTSPGEHESGYLRAVIISQAGASVRRSPVEYYRYHSGANGHWVGYAFARWVFSAKDACVCNNGCIYGWCKQCM